MRLSEYQYHDMIHRCFRCGYCKFPTDWSDITNCPPYARFRLESYSAGGRLWLIRAWLNGEIEWSPHLAEIVYSCVSCNNCVEKCPHSFKDDVVNMIVAAKTVMIDQGKVPRPVADFLTNVQLHGNPYGMAAKKRDIWMEGLDLEPFAGQDYLFYVGCEGSYDSRAQGAARATAALFKQAGLSFGVLGSREIVGRQRSGDAGRGRPPGRSGRKEHRAFLRTGCAKDRSPCHPIPTTCSETATRRWGVHTEVFHHSQVLAGLVKEGKTDDPRTAGHGHCLSRPLLSGPLEPGIQRPAKGADGRARGHPAGNAAQPTGRTLLRRRCRQLHDRFPGRQ
jgi:Fe-S oxidoreductase